MKLSKILTKHHTNEKGFAPIILILAAVGLITFLLIASIAPLREGILGSIFTKDSSFAASNLPVPASLKIEPDDRNAILKWDNYAVTWPLNARPQGVTGYVVYWGVYDSTSQTIINPQKRLTEDTAIQLQPLNDGLTYGAYVQSIDTLGNVSVASPIITYKSDSTRVNTLRTQMNGFFDDFNVNAGSFNELKWNWALSSCAGAGGTGALNGQFINNQFHAHNQSFSSHCDRSQNVSRPRTVFDFSPGVQRPTTNSQFPDSEFGTIVFDFDGSQGRDRWYLDMYDVANGIVDIPSRASDDLNLAQSPFNNIRIVHSGGGKPEVFKVDEKGFLWNALPTPGAQITCDMTCETTINVRNQWVIKVSKQRLVILINGKIAADVSGWRDGSGDHTNGLNLPFTKAHLLWVQFSYNTPKADMPSSLIHWDNFGFNAPTSTTQTVETHNYIDGNIGMPVNNACHVGNGPPGTLCVNGTTTIKIPDSLSGATASRLMFIASGEIGWNATDHILLNGNKYPIPDPKSLPLNVPLGTPTRIMDGITPLQFVIPINTAHLITGDNKVQLVSNGFQMLNIHAEFDFPKVSAPSYTQPKDIWNINTTPTLTANGTSEIPNHIQIETVHGKDKNGILAGWQVWNFPDFILQADSNGNEPAGGLDPCGWCGRTKIQMAPNEPIYQSGTVTINFTSTGRTAAAGVGSYPGHQAYQVWIDRQKVLEQRTDTSIPAPRLDTSYAIDTTKLCNGTHEIFMESYTPSGKPSQAAATHANIDIGNYAPITIYTRNTGQQNCPTPQPNPSLPVFTLTGASPLPSNSAIQSPTPVAFKVGDINGDTKIDIQDYNALLGEFGKKNDAQTKADLDNDDDVDIFDYNTFLGLFGK